MVGKADDDVTLGAGVPIDLVGSSFVGVLDLHPQLGLGKEVDEQKQDQQKSKGGAENLDHRRLLVLRAGFARSESVHGGVVGFKR